MTTFRGAMRSYAAAARRAEREQQRRALEAAKRYKELEKLQAIKDATQAVKDWQNYVDTLKSVHKSSSDIIDWHDVKAEPQPAQPVRKNENESFAEFRLKTYRPSFIDKIFGKTKRKIFQLETAVSYAKSQDEKKFADEVEQFNKDMQDWKTLQDIADGVHKLNPESYIDALKFFNPFSDIGELGSKIVFSCDDTMVDIDLHINGKDVIPNYELNQTSTGKLSRKDMPKTRFFELYQDYVCSCILRIARETFAHLPIDKARINAVSDMLNPSTGHMEDSIILSVIVSNNTLNKLNLDSIDPSDSMSNFVHNMRFKKATGFEIVSKVEL